MALKVQLHKLGLELEMKDVRSAITLEGSKNMMKTLAKVQLLLMSLYLLIFV